MAIEDVMARLDKKTRDRVMMASDINIQRYPWASLGLTVATGGLARGRVHLVYGNRSSGKSLVTVQTVGKLQREFGLTAAIIDSEGTTDPAFIESLGVDSKSLLVSHDKSFKGAQEASIEFLKAGVDILIIDSISTLIPEAFLEDNGEVKGADGQKQIGARAKSTGVLMNSLHYSNVNDAIIIVISQARMSLGSMHASLAFDGGKAMEHAASQILRVTAPSGMDQQIKGEFRVGTDLVLEKSIGREVKCFVEKNKLGRAAEEVKYNMYYAGDYIGIDTFEETVRLGVEVNVISKGGSWLKYDGQQWQGSKNMGKELRNEHELFVKLQKDIATAMGVAA